MYVKTSDWDELLRLAGTKQVRYVKHINDNPAYQNLYNSNGQLIVHTG